MSSVVGLPPFIATTHYKIIEEQCNKTPKCMKEDQIGDLSHSDEVYDVVVVGGGCAGAAAAKTANRIGLKVLLIEEGDKDTGSMVWAPSYTHELIGSEIDTGARSGVPLAGGSVDENVSIDHPADNNDNKSGQSGPRGPKECTLRYPRGKGLGGTSNLDWAVSFASIFMSKPSENPNEEKACETANSTSHATKKNNGFFYYKGDIGCRSDATGTEIPLADATFKNPLSWGFEQSVTNVLDIRAGTESNSFSQLNLQKSDDPIRHEDDKDLTVAPELSFEARRLPVVGKAVSALLRVAQVSDIRVLPVAELLSSQSCVASSNKESCCFRGITVLTNCRVIEIIYENNERPTVENTLKQNDRIDNNSESEQRCSMRRVVGVRIEHLKDLKISDKHTSNFVVRPRKGVILCAGIIGTPRILCQSLGSEIKSNVINDGISGFCDSIGFPVIYEAHPGLSDDVHNVHSIRSILSWALTRKGPVTHVVSNSMVVIDVPRYPGAQVLIQMLPHGGYNRRRFSVLGLSKSLGVFKEAFTFYVSIHKLANNLNLSKTDVRENSDEAPQKTPLTMGNVDIYEEGLGSVMLSADSFHNDYVLPHCKRSSFSDTEGQSSVFYNIIVDCLEYGFSFVRDVVQQDPLRTFTTGREAIDTCLFPKDDALRVYRVLYGTSFSARQVKQKQKEEVERCRKIAQETVLSSTYMHNYIVKHSRYMGYGTGTSWSFLDKTTNPQLKREGDGETKNKSSMYSFSSTQDSVQFSENMTFSHRVALTSNLYVGDVSCVPPFLSFHHGFQNSGGVETTMDCGKRAALELAGK